MQNAKRLILNILSVFFLLFAFILVIQNLTITAPIQILTWSVPEVPIGSAMAATAVFLGLSIYLKSLTRIAQLGEQQQKARRELERKEVSREESDAQVRVLETKIQTLEKALSEALKQ